MKITILRAAAATTLALLASACADQKKLQFCPGMPSVLDASMETVFRPGTSPDPANALYPKDTSADAAPTVPVVYEAKQGAAAKDSKPKG